MDLLLLLLLLLLRVGVLLSDSISKLLLLRVELGLLEVEVVREVVVQLGVDDRLDQFLGVLAQLL